MKPKSTIAVAALAVAIGSLSFAPSLAQSGESGATGKTMTETDSGSSSGSTMGPGMSGGRMGPGMGGGMMGPMMGRMMGGGMMGHGMMRDRAGFRREKPLSNAEIKRVVDGKLAMAGLSRLSVGTVSGEDKEAANVEVVSSDGKLVFKLKVDRDTGRSAIVE